MDHNEAYERLLREGFTAQQLENLARLGKDYARREMLDFPLEDRSSADDRLGSGLDRLSQWLKKESAFMFTQRHFGLLLIAISAASFGVMPILARFAYAAGSDPITTLWLRFGIAAMVMTAVMLMRRMPFPRGRVLLGLVLMGAVGYAGVSLAYFTALTMASAGLVALLLYLYPALVMVLSVVFLRERLRRVTVGSLFLALVGTALTTGLVGGASTLGIFLGIVAALLYAIYILVGSRVVHQAGSIASSTIVMISAATSYSGMVIIHGPAMPQSMSGWVAVVAIALVSTVLAFVTFFAGLKLVGPITASTLSTLEPVVTVGLASVILSETIGLLQLCGGVLILLAAITLIRSETRQQRPNDPQGGGSTEREAALIGIGEAEGRTSCSNVTTTTK
jgi:drug/metabolite transporter (DMT)-like permease